MSNDKDLTDFERDILFRSIVARVIRAESDLFTYKLSVILYGLGGLVMTVLLFFFHDWKELLMGSLMIALYALFVVYSANNIKHGKRIYSEAKADYFIVAGRPWEKNPK